MRRAKKRQLSVFLLSFLDIMAGGFGAVVLIFLIVDHNTVKTEEIANQQQLAEIRLLDYEREQGEKRLAEIRETIGDLRVQIADAKERVENLLQEVEVQVEAVEEVERQAIDQSESLEELKSEVESKEDELARLQRQADVQQPATIEIVGQGDRQYLTGLYLGGNNILVALDTSASMLHEQIVNILILKNHARDVKLKAQKWTQAVDIVEWLVAKLPLASKMQIATFNKEAKLVVDDGDWHDATDGPELVKAVEALRETVPEHGTDLERLFTLMADMSPIPDNVFLITDGLPTIRDSNASRRRTMVDSNERHRLFNRALAELPAGITINVILLPLEGDPFAAGNFWALAHNTGGTFMTPSKDWP